MAGNPNPQHNPTDGLGVAVAIQLSGSSGSSVVTALRTPGANKPYPGVYTLTLSVAAAGGFAATLTPTATLVDASNAAYTPTGTFRWRSYNNPAAGSPGWYHPSNFNDGTMNYVGAESNAAVNNTTGAITVTKPGQAIIECSFPAFDNTQGLTAGGSIDNTQPIYQSDIYVHIILTVIP